MALPAEVPRSVLPLASSHIQQQLHAGPVQSVLGKAHAQPRSSRQLGGDGKDLLQARKSLLSPAAGPQWAATMLASPAPLPNPAVTRGGRAGSRGGEGRRGLREGDKESGSWLVPAARGGAGSGPDPWDVAVAVPAWTPRYAPNPSILEEPPARGRAWR